MIPKSACIAQRPINIVYCSLCLRRSPLIDILDTLDVVFAEIAAGLHFDQLERDLALVGHAVNAADRQIDRLVLMHFAHRIVDRDLGGAVHDDPVLGAVAVFLQ